MAVGFAQESFSACWRKQTILVHSVIHRRMCLLPWIINQNAWRFTSLVFRCQPCNCHPSGALNETCHLVTGRCFCKRFVTASTCDTCVPGASHLDASNPWGCSKSESALSGPALGCEEPAPGREGLCSLSPLRTHQESFGPGGKFSSETK